MKTRSALTFVISPRFSLDDYLWSIQELYNARVSD
jgi:hypothetical protein